MSAPSASPRRSLLAQVALLLAAIVAVAIAGMISSILIAQVTQGLATAVNQSGTLRMQSYRLGMALTDRSLPLTERRARVAALAAEFEARLTSPRLLDVIPRAGDDPLRLAYEGVRWRWAHTLRRAIDGFVSGADGTADAAGATYLNEVDGFVDDVHALVRRLEDAAEARIDLLRLLQGGGLALIVVLVGLTLAWLRLRVVTPLGVLLGCADRAGRGDFDWRNRSVGDDELGRLGTAMNLMAEALQQRYRALEARIAAKTRDLMQRNQSLTLLYDTSRRLDAAPLSAALLQEVLDDVRDRLGLAAIDLCLDAGGALGIGGCVRSGCRAGDGDPPATAGSSAEPLVSPPAALLTLPIAAVGQRFGELRIVQDPLLPLADWQLPLLHSLAGQLSTALARQRHLHETRRLMLHEERSSLARELHDSLAQSLSYLKIQAARLELALRDQGGSGTGCGAGCGIGNGATDGAGSEQRYSGAEPAVILAGMRDGISSAYRQLRELLTTFRLRIDGQGLASALADTVQEFRDRSALGIDLTDRLRPGLLSPNEEVHVLQIVREALSNVVRHAAATHCVVAIASDPGGGVSVRITDDGVGLPPQPCRRGHYGLSIMQERAASLGGTLDLGPGASGGTCVRLCFRPRRGSAEPLEPSGSAAATAPSAGA